MPCPTQHWVNGGKKFDFMGRGLYEHARFAIPSCSCEAVVQTLNAQLRGKKPNSGIAAIAVRVGDVTAGVTGSGEVTVSGGGHDAVLPPATSASATTFGALSITRERVTAEKRAGGGSVWAWRFVFPNGAGNLLLYAVALKSMPSGFMCGCTHTLPQKPLLYIRAATSRGLSLPSREHALGRKVLTGSLLVSQRAQLLHLADSALRSARERRRLVRPRLR